MRERISAIVAIALLLLLIGTSYFYAVQSKLKDLKYIPSEQSPDYIAKNATLTTFDESGSPVRRLFAKKMLRYSNDRTDAEDPKLVTLDKNKPQVIATAAHGWSSDGGETFLFDGGVTITRSPWQGSPAMKFSTQQLTVYPDTERFVSKSPVTFLRGADTTTALSMDYNHVRGTIKLTGGVKTRISRNPTR